MDIESVYEEVKKILLNKNIFNPSALDYRIMVFNQKMKKLFTKYGDVDERMRNIDEVFGLIHQYLGVSEVEKKINGEVFTPFELINEMLDTLPKEVWSNPNLKWLDPANGIGNFPAVIIQRLMSGLVGFEPDPSKRYKHILENMIYICDISSKNMFLYLNIFDPYNEYKMNYFKGSFLSDEFDKHMKEVWGVNGFNVIVGNPPYQTNNNKSNKLWVKFLNKVYSKNPVLITTFVVPTSIMESNSKQIKEIRSHLKDRGNEFNLTKKNVFNIGEEVVFFTSHMVDGIKKTKIVFEDDKTLILDSTKIIGRIPTSSYDKFKLSIITKVENLTPKLDYVFDFNYNSNKTTPKKLILNGYVSENYDDKFKYVVHHSASKILYAKDINSPYSKNGQSTFGKLKVLFNYSGGFVGDKYMFMTKNLIGKQMVGIYVDDEKQGLNLIKIYSTKLFRWYVSNEKTGGFNTGIFKLPKMDLTKEWTDQQLYEYFDLTEEEINLIEETVKE